MDKKLLNWVSPLMLGMVLALVWIGYGVLHSDREYNQIYVVFGLPLLAVSAGLHWLIRRLTNGNSLAVWVIELAIIGGVVYYIRR